MAHQAEQRGVVMSNGPCERLESRLDRAGWAVVQRRSGPAEDDGVRPQTWLLKSLRAPAAARVELLLRLWERYSWGYVWYDSQLSAVTVRFPADEVEGSPEATLVGVEIERENFRQLVRI